jgi:hypothetical protein
MKKSKSVKGCGIYDKSINFLTGSKLKDGEKHVIIYDTKNKKYTAANYIGPGTNIITRLKNKDEPIVKSDKVAQAHDIRYSLSKNVEGIKDADDKMVNKLKSLRKNKEDINFNTIPAQLGIQANQLLAKILPTKLFDKFVNYMTDYKKFNETLNEDDKKLLEDKLKELESEGFGKIKRKYKKK